MYCGGGRRIWPVLVGGKVRGPELPLKFYKMPENHQDAVGIERAYETTCLSKTLPVLAPPSGHSTRGRCVSGADSAAGSS
jgi:hypothetical protein